MLCSFAGLQYEWALNMTTTLQQAAEAMAIMGGSKTVTGHDPHLFRWPIVTLEDEEAVLDVLRRGAMSGTEITKQFEKEIAQWLGMNYALGYCNGTESLRAAFWAGGVGAGGEIILPRL